MEVNLFAALIVAVMNMIIGFVWYGPLFAKTWMKEVGLTEKEIGNGPGIGYLITTIVAFVMGLVMSLLVHRLGITNVTDGLLLALLAWVGFVMPSFVANYIFARKSTKLLSIDSGYFLVTMLAAGVITTLVR